MVASGWVPDGLRRAVKLNGGNDYIFAVQWIGLRKIVLHHCLAVFSGRLRQRVFTCVR
jgi:hypothetical protein